MPMVRGVRFRRCPPLDRHFSNQSTISMVAPRFGFYAEKAEEPFELGVVASRWVGQGRQWHGSNLIMPWWIDIVALIVGFVVLGLATIQLIAGHYTREIRGD